jgi:hypothetical protein
MMAPPKAPPPKPKAKAKPAKGGKPGGVANALAGLAKK